MTALFAFRTITDSRNRISGNSHIPQMIFGTHEAIHKDRARRWGSLQGVVLGKAHCKAFNM